MDIELIVLSYLNCDSGRYLSSFAFCAFAVFTWGLPALIVCLAGAVESLAGAIETGRSPKEEKGRRGLLKINVIVIPLWLSPSRLGTAPEGISGINLTPSSSLGVVGLVFPLLEACSAFSLAARARSASSDLVNPLVSARPYVFVCTTYFRFGIGSGLLIGSFCITK